MTPSCCSTLLPTDSDTAALTRTSHLICRGGPGLRFSSVPPAPSSSAELVAGMADKPEAAVGERVTGRVRSLCVQNGANVFPTAASAEMTGAPAPLSELRRARTEGAAWLLNLVLPEVGGGRFVAADFARIEERPDASALRVSGLDQPMFETLISRDGRHFSAIQFWKCPRVADLAPLESLPDLRLVSIFWNQRATGLWDLANASARRPAFR